MMEFSNHKAIYLQIADMICEKILLKQFTEGERIPAVREMAAQLAVNPNTVMRSYELLQELGIITNKRGVGYSVSADGQEKALTYLKDKFIQKELPGLFRTAALLNIRSDELKSQYDIYQQGIC